MIKFYDSMGASQGISVLSDLVDACDFWQSEQAVNVGDIARSSTDSLIYAECILSGITGMVEPAWGNEEGVSVIDGNAKWQVHDLRNAKTANEAEKLTNARKINGIEFDGSKDIVLPSDTVDDSTYIAKGIKVAGFDSHEVYISSGIAKINGSTVNFNGGSLKVGQRETALMYLESEGKLGKVIAKYPTDWIDDHTLGFWIFNKTIAGENVPNIAVGRSAIAQDNDFIPYGGISSVDGWADYALQTDGLTGYFELANNLGFMTGVVPFEYDILITPDKIDGSTDYIFNYAGNVTTIYINSNGLLYCGGQNTGYICETGKTFFLSFVYDSRIAYIYIDGRLVFQVTVNWNLSLNTSQNTRIGCAYDKSDMLPATFHYLEIRNAIRSPEEIAKIANELLLPCFYYKGASCYPSMPEGKTGYAEWRFDDETPDMAKDSNEIYSAVLGSTVVPVKEDSRLGLGKALRFPGDNNCYLNIGSMTIPQEFTLVAVVNPFQLASYGRFFANTYNTSQTFIVSTCCDGGGGQFGFYTGNQNGGTWINSGLVAQVGQENFMALRVTSKNYYFRVNRDCIIKPNNHWKKSITTECSIGSGYGTGYPLKGAISYMLFVPKALSDSEIQMMYDSLMVRGRKNILDDSVPSNGAAIGFIRADTNSVFEYNDTDYKYGRREGAVGGNRKVFLGYKYFSGTTILTWDNPFGTQKVKRYFTWASDSKGTNEIEAMKMVYVYNSGWGGIWPFSDSATGNDDMKITAYISTAYGGVTIYNSAWKSSGYIGCYVEVLENYKGVDGR